MKHCIFFPLLFCSLHVMRVSRFSVISTTWFTVAATFARFVALLVAFKALFVFIPALIGIVKLASTTGTFSSFIWLLRISWWQFRFLLWVLVHAVNSASLLGSHVLSKFHSADQVYSCRPFPYAVPNSIAFLNSN